MPRQRSPSRDKAKQMYLDSKGKMLLKDIATAVGKQDTQIRRWKSLDHWDDELKGNVTFPKDNVINRNKGIEEQPKAELLPEEIETLNNEELTEKQRLFCLYYVRWFNATKAYQKAYDCDYTTAMVNGCKLLSNHKIKEHIQAIKDAKIKQSMYSAEDFFQKMMDIIYSDATDYMDFGQEEVPVMAMYGPVEVKDPVTGEKKQLTKDVNYVRFKDSLKVDGTLIQEVKQGRDGCSIKLVSKEFALKWLDRNIGMASEEQRARIDQLKAQTQKLQREKDNETPDVQVVIHDDIPKPD